MPMHLDVLVHALPVSGTLVVPMLTFFIWRERSLCRVIKTGRRERRELRAALSERDAALERLRLVSDRFAVALEAARMAVWETDMATGKVYRSDLHDELYGHPEGFPEWTHERFMNTLHPEDRPQVQKQVDQIFSGEITDYHSVFRVQWPNGEWHWIDSRARVLRDDHGKVTTVRGAIIDITELKQTQLELQQAVRVRDEFLSLASHELKTPLTSLLMSVQLLQRCLNTGGKEALLSEDLPSRFTALEKQVFRLSALVNNLLDIARIQGGKFKLDPRRFDLAVLARDFCERICDEHEADKERFSCSIPSHLEIYADPLRVEQVLTNLVTNAFKYGNHSPVRLELTATGSNVQIVVSDQGPGIAPEDHDRVFQRFEQGQSPNRKAGLGLGLYIVRQIVHEHGGQIELQSAPGIGATFIVTLPL